jgi:hypothetical protein
MKNDLLNSMTSPGKLRETNESLIKSISINVKDIEKSKECKIHIYLVAGILNSYQKQKDQTDRGKSITRRSTGSDSKTNPLIFRFLITP